MEQRSLTAQQWNVPAHENSRFLMAEAIRNDKAGGFVRCLMSGNPLFTQLLPP
jgi:hypothetical protein